MKISKVRNVKTPTRGTGFSAGIDFYLPVFDKKFCEDLFAKNKGIGTIARLMESKSITIPPHCRLLIPSGVHVNFMDNLPRALINFNKSGVSSKTGLDVLASVIDQDYQGELHLSVNNNSSEYVTIKEGEKLIQGIMLLITYEEIQLVSIEELYSEKTDRGEGGFGSTGK